MSNKSLEHLGIIMDGNRRWAKARGMSEVEGHKAGYKRLKSLLKVISESDIKYVSIYSFSSENWSRTQKEVSGLMQLLGWALQYEIQEIIDNQLRIRFIGSEDKLASSLIRQMRIAEENTKSFQKTLLICFNYSGQQEIVDAANKAAKSGVITIDNLQQHLYAPDVPSCDLIIRTSGEQRLSNFMLWRSSYSELAFTETLWPDFSDDELRTIIKEFSDRQRRFGS